MMEPDPSNVTGEVVRSHSFEHRVNWGHVVLGLALLYAAYHGVRLLESVESDSESDAESDAPLIPES